jgi:hypothetical protein
MGALVLDEPEPAHEAEGIAHSSDVESGTERLWRSSTWSGIEPHRAELAPVAAVDPINDRLAGTTARVTASVVERWVTDRCRA